MKEILLKLLEVANKIHFMRGVHTNWCKAGLFTHNGKTYSFIIENLRGTIRRIDINSEENEWFDIVVIPGGNKYSSIIHNGKIYDLQPTLQL
jgi:hypothetical protein